MADDHLIRAARNGRREIAHELLQLPGIDANAADTKGTTALYWAARNGQREIAHELQIKQRSIELWRQLRDVVRVRPFAIFWLQFVQEQRYRPGGAGFNQELADWESMALGSQRASDVIEFSCLSVGCASGTRARPEDVVHAPALGVLDVDVGARQPHPGLQPLPQPLRLLFRGLRHDADPAPVLQLVVEHRDVRRDVAMNVHDPHELGHLATRDALTGDGQHGAHACVWYCPWYLVWL